MKPAPPPPIPLTPDARRFWDRHYRRLRRAGILTRADLESFLLLCQTWAKLQALADVQPGADSYREMIQHTNLSKQYQALAKQFGCLPRERKQAKMDAEPPARKDEFGL